jgi:hypothetical protein
MKKGFIKKLAFVSAFAITCSGIAPVSASAARTPRLNAKSKTLFLQTKRDDYNFNIKYKVKGSKYTWSSSNESVATVNKKNGIVTGKEVGKTTITCEIKLPSGKTKVLTAPVSVKSNITDIDVNNEPTDVVAVGKAIDLNDTYKTPGGKTTSKVKWAVTKGSESATVDANGVFKATKPGDYEVTVMAFQSNKKYKEYLAGDTTRLLASDTVKIKVGNEIASVAQVDLDSVKVTFAAPITKDNAKKITLYQVIGTAKVSQLIKNVTLSDDGKAATVDFYVPFTAEGLYQVNYPGMESAQFAAAQTKAESVASMRIITKKAIVGGEGTTVEYKLYDKNGVDITDSSNLDGRVDMSVKGDQAWLNTTDNKLTIFTKGAVANVTATYHTRNFDQNTGKEIGNIVVTAPIVGVESQPVAFGNVKAYTITSGSADFDKPVHLLGAGDNDYKLFVKISGTKDGTTSDYTNTDPNAADASKWSFSSTDETTLMMSGNILIPVKQGSAVVIVKYDDKVVATIQVQIGQKQAVTSLNLDNSNFTLYSNISQTKTVKITAKDQFQRTVSLDTNDHPVTITRLSAPTGASEIAGTVAYADGAATYTFTTDTNTPKGYYNYKVATGKTSRYIRIHVQSTTAQSASYQKLSLSTSKFDVKATTATKTSGIGINVFGYASDGIVMEDNTSAIGSEYKVVVTGPDNNEYTMKVADNGIYKLVTLPEAGATDKKITQATAGHYKVTLFKKSGEGFSTTPSDVKYFTVENTQAKATLASIKTLYPTTSFTDASTLQSVIPECFNITLPNGNTATPDDIASVECQGTVQNGAAYVKSVTVKVSVGDNYVLEKVAINQPVRYQAAQ